MSTPVLSYIITTRNKLPYLKETMARLLNEQREDEDICVADGASTDGTKEFLAELYRLGKIHDYTSEPDLGESHALNKLFLRARGKLMKIITDDDAFYYPGIRQCKEFLLEHPDIDLLATNGGFKNQRLEAPVRPLTYTEHYDHWLKDHTPFSFCGLGIMFRTNSIPLLGLWNPSFRRADMEFSLRVTSGKANVAWRNAPCFVNISTPQSVSVVYMKKILVETQKLEQMYLDKKPEHVAIRKIKALGRKLRNPTLPRNTPEAAPSVIWQTLFEGSNQWLYEKNKSSNGEFLFRR